MLKIRTLSLMLGLLISPLAAADANVSVGFTVPGLSIGINLPAYPRLVRVPDYPVYYAPELQANYFFYDGMYWVYQNDDWYMSSWYNGPWGRVDRVDVPMFILRIPVRYYRQPPAYFHEWGPNAAPHWGDHWGRDWEQHRSDWVRWERPAPLPAYQGQYSGERYPRHLEQQYQLQQQKYRYQPRDPEVQRYYQEHGRSQSKGQVKDKDKDHPGQGHNK